MSDGSAERSVASDAAHQPWTWDVGDQPAYTPRRATVPSLALERLRRHQEHVTLGWFHRYPARFATDVVTGILAETVTRAERAVRAVLDPFCGTGAVISACRQLDITSVGVELTTLGVNIGKLRLAPPRNPWEVTATCERIARHARSTDPDLPPELTQWLGELNAGLLTTYLREISALDEPRARRFVTVALSQALRPSSRWLAGSVKAQTDPTRTPTPLHISFRRSARRLAQDCDVEQDALAQPGDPLGLTRPAGTILQGDARALPLLDHSIDAIVTSPPYFITYDYFDVQRLSYLAFGWPIRRSSQIGAKYGHPQTRGAVDLPAPFRSWYETSFEREQTLLGRALRAYVDGLRSHLAEAYRVLSPGGIAAYSLANSIRAGRVFDLVGGFGELLNEAGFTDITVVPRCQAGRRILPPGRHTATGRFSSDANRAGTNEMVVYAQRPQRATGW